MSSEKEQNTQDHNQKSVDYHNLFKSLERQNEKMTKQCSNLKEEKSKNTSVSAKLEKNRREKQQSSYTYQKARSKESVTDEIKNSNQDKLYQSACPYCGKRVGYFKKWMLKNKGDYVCNACGNRSIVVINKIVVPMAIITVIISVLLVLLFTFLVDMEIWSIILIFIPFLIFFLASVFTVRLKQIVPNSRRKRKKTVKDHEYHTRVL